MFTFLRRDVSRRHCKVESPKRCLPCVRPMGHDGMCRSVIFNKDGRRGYYAWWSEISIRELWIGIGGDEGPITGRDGNSGETASEE